MRPLHHPDMILTSYLLLAFELAAPWRQSVLEQIALIEALREARGIPRATEGWCPV